MERNRYNKAARLIERIDEIKEEEETSCCSDVPDIFTCIDNFLK